MSIYRQYMVIAPRGINFMGQSIVTQKQTKDNTFLARLFSTYPTNKNYPKTVKKQIAVNKTKNYKVETYLWGNGNEIEFIKEMKTNRKVFIVLYSPEVGCRESSSYYTDDYMNFAKRAGISSNRIRIVFEVTNIYNSKNEMQLKHYTNGVRIYVNQFAERELIYEELDAGLRRRIIHNFILKSIDIGRLAIAVSCLGFLFGSYFYTFNLSKNTLPTSRIKGKTFKNKLINTIMKGQSTSSHAMTYVNSAFFFDSLILLDLLGDIKIRRVIDKAKHNGIATFSHLVANNAHPKLYIKFLNKYKIKLNKIPVSNNNCLWFSNWQDIENLFKLTSKDKGSW